MLFGRGNGHYAPKSNKYPLQEGPFWASWRSLVWEENILGCGDVQRGGKEIMEIDMLNQVLKNWGFPGGTSGKEPPANAGDIRDVGSIPGSGRSPGGGYGNLHQYYCLENPMDRQAWRSTIHRVTKSRTRLKRVNIQPKHCIAGTSQVQWLRLCTSNAEGLGSVPVRGTNIPHAAQLNQKTPQINSLNN